MPWIRHTTRGDVMHVEYANMWCEPHMGYEVIPTALGNAEARTQAGERLRELLARVPLVHGHKHVYTILRHVSASGMTRVIDLVMIADGEPISISHYAADILDRSYTNERVRGLKVRGAGMDMGWHTVDALGCALGLKNAKTGLGTLRHEWL